MVLALDCVKPPFYSQSLLTFQGSIKIPNSVSVLTVYGVVRDGDSSNKFSGWKMLIDDSTEQTISAIKNLCNWRNHLITDAPTTSLMAGIKAYVDGLTGLAMVYKVIRTRTRAQALINDPNETWLDAVSVALVGQFTLSTANNSGIKIPDTVKQIHGFNSAKITITNFAWHSTTAKGGLWYATLPTSGEIRNLEVDCNGYAFRNCTNMTNCIGIGDVGFYECADLANTYRPIWVWGPLGTASDSRDGF